MTRFAHLTSHRGGPAAARPVRLGSGRPRAGPGRSRRRRCGWSVGDGQASGGPPCPGHGRSRTGDGQSATRLAPPATGDDPGRQRHSPFAGRRAGGRGRHGRCRPGRSSSSRTMDPGSGPRTCRTSSSGSTEPRAHPAAGPVSAWPSPSGSWTATADGSTSRIDRKVAPVSWSACRAAGARPAEAREARGRRSVVMVAAGRHGRSGPAGRRADPMRFSGPAGRRADPCVSGPAGRPHAFFCPAGRRSVRGYSPQS